MVEYAPLWAPRTGYCMALSKKPEEPRTRERNCVLASQFLRTEMNSRSSKVTPKSAPRATVSNKYHPEGTSGTPPGAKTAFLTKQSQSQSGLMCQEKTRPVRAETASQAPGPKAGLGVRNTRLAKRRSLPAKLKKNLSPLKLHFLGFH